ncbi:ADP-ribosylglycohydrolase family protein [Clostridium brassicae]|uniref:ADP-ribosylglycohydrolase family protein n=1 Tax=Clostridium brassicae TaxID=2999072 RepID=A0ABT4DDP7_9CLOT|nr:ADP-ribosylglycohydrolase family protein [Clostridium brassicae]MCY6960432.1 ADP-ribosylglycohydrolase family protein [Clostridium brassicae]
MKHIDRIRGGLFGVACGDALHRCLKNIRNKKIYKGSIKDIKQYYLIYGDGKVTDDTRMMVAIAKSVVESPEDPIDLMGKRFIEIHYNNPINLGLTIRVAIGEYEKCKDWKKAALKTHLRLGGRSEGNGTLMRTIPIALYYDDIHKMTNITKKQSNLTHYSRNASEACIFYNILAYSYVRGEDKYEAFINNVKRFPEYQDILDKGENSFTKTGCAVDTLKCSLWCFLNTESYEEAIIKAMNVYDNKDTVATIAGGIAGVYYGYSGIDKVWKQNLAIKEELLNISDKFWLNNNVYLTQ